MKFRGEKRHQRPICSSWSSPLFRPAPCSSSGAMLSLLGKLNQPSNSQGARYELESFNLVCAEYKFIIIFFLNSGRGYAKPLTLTVHISFKTGFLQPTLNCISHFPLLLYLLTIENTWTGAKSQPSCAQFLFF